MVMYGYEEGDVDAAAVPGVTVLPRGDMSRRLVASATSQAGLSAVYSELFDQVPTPPPLSFPPSQSRVCGRALGGKG